MNRYGAMARRHWAQWLPGRYAAVSDPDSFFTTLGEDVARQVENLTEELAGDGRPGEGYLVRVGRLNASRTQAEEIILPERVLLAPEPAASQDPQEDDQPLAGGQRPLVVNRSSQLWAEVNAEQQERIHGPA